jgi:hypothetical protein
MEVIPSQLRQIGAALHDLAAELRAGLTGDRAGPGDPAWATDRALRVQLSAWDAYLTGLAARLEMAGDGLGSAATGYVEADDRAVRRWGRRLC